MLEVAPDAPLSEMTPKELFRFRDEWQPKGSCYKTDSTVFFPKVSGVPELPKALCLGGKVTLIKGEEEVEVDVLPCAVKDTCLAWAEVTGQQHGIWGGKRFDKDRQEPTGKRKGKA